MPSTNEEHADRCATAYASFMTILEENGPDYAVEVATVTVLAMFMTVASTDREAAQTLLDAMQAVVDAVTVSPTASFKGVN